jgi:hypothetical protein
VLHILKRYYCVTLSQKLLLCYTFSKATTVLHFLLQSIPFQVPVAIIATSKHIKQLNKLITYKHNFLHPTQLQNNYIHRIHKCLQLRLRHILFCAFDIKQCIPLKKLNSSIAILKFAHIYTLEPVYNDIGLYNISSITSDILWYQLIHHC